jgi:cobalt-precorrin-5B (C1)-methyltransferase
MGNKLRSGFTTGTASAAAAKGAIRMILEGKRPSQVQIRLLTGAHISIAIHSCRLRKNSQAICSVIKDAGDDPDVTHKAEIGALVTLVSSNKLPATHATGQRANIRILGGEGVGRVTKPGLEVAPGQPAINPGPQKMIRQAIEDVLQEHHLFATVDAEIFVPRGKKLAEKTLNARLGILDGISILGTTGIVRPMSHDAFIATIESALSVARASGLEQVILTTGRRSERFAQSYWHRMDSEAFIQIGDFFRLSLESAAKRGFSDIILAVFFGKALKMAQGVPHTHAAKSSLTLDKLSEWTLEISKNSTLSQQIANANTARHAFFILRDHQPQVIVQVGNRIVAAAKRFAGQQTRIQSIIFSYDGEVVFDSENQRPPAELGI